jgi:hypothetical protein
MTAFREENLQFLAPLAPAFRPLITSNVASEAALAAFQITQRDQSR